MSTKCAHVHPPGHAKAGLQCGAWSLADSEFCPIHSGLIDPSEIGTKGGAATRYKGLPPSESADPIAALSRAVSQLEDMKPSPEVLRTITAAASALDRAQNSAEARGADITRIEVVYVNDWRAE